MLQMANIETFKEQTVEAVNYFCVQLAGSCNLSGKHISDDGNFDAAQTITGQNAWTALLLYAFTAAVPSH